jgi:hypothetical protein
VNTTPVLVTPPTADVGDSGSESSEQLRNVAKDKAMTAPPPPPKSSKRAMYDDGSYWRIVYMFRTFLSIDTCCNIS